jgi:hypothetical protein
VLLWMDSLGMIFKDTILPHWNYNLDGDCSGDAIAGCFIGIARKGVSILVSDLSYLSQSNNIM